MVTIQMILSFMTQFHRKDQLTIGACAIAIYILQYPEDFRRASFRGLVLMLFVSVIYDVLWFHMTDDLNDDSDGGVERGIKQFALSVSYLGFIWKVSISSIVNLTFYTSLLDCHSNCILERFT